MTDEVKAPENRGTITVTFTVDDGMSVQYSDVKPWKLWAAGAMLKSLGDQMIMQAQAEQFQRQAQEHATRQQLLQSISTQPGGLRGPVRLED